MSDDVRAEVLRLAVGLRRLLAAEREGGLVDVPGVPGAAAAAAAAAALAAASVPAVAAARPTQTRTARAAASAARTEPAFVPRVRPLEVPSDVLAPFGDLPARVAACRTCRLAEARTQTVFGEGDPAARLVFCGEGPGEEEDLSGRPFVGRAGELLTAMIEKGLKMRREDVFILNAVKCRPPGNRTPAPDEMAACRPFLDAQLATIRPKVIVALGNPACLALLGTSGITKLRGRVFDAFGTKVVPTWHPAYLLRNPDAKREAWEDLKLVLRLLD